MEAFESLFRTALSHVNSGNLTQAQAACDLLHQTQPQHPAVLQLQATIALRSGRPAEAWHLMRQAIKTQPDHVPALVLAGRSALATGLPDQATPLLRRAIAQAPDNPEPAFLLCHALLNRNDPSLDAAIAAAGEKHQRQSAHWQSLGVALQRARRPVAALTAFTHAAIADPVPAGPHFGRGLALRDLGRLQPAQAALRQAVVLDPTISEAWFSLGLTCQDLDDEAGAAAAFRSAMIYRPAFAEAAVNLGIALQRLGDMTAALEAYQTAVSIRADTFGRVAQAVTAASTGKLWLSPAAFRRALS